MVDETNEDEVNLQAMRIERYVERLRLAHEDGEREVHIVESVGGEIDPLGGACVCRFTEGTSLIVRAVFRNADGKPHARTPEPGDRLALYGRGLGHEVRGIGLMSGESTRLAGLYRYETEEEMRQRHVREVEKKKADNRREWDAAKEENARRVAALPEPFRARFEFFMRNPSWGGEFGKYELFVMSEAVKIHAALKTVEAIESFNAKTNKEQQALVPDLDDGHSGNTLGCAVSLAHAYAKALAGSTAKVYQHHGAMCPLVGCVAYGCYSTEVKKKS